MDNRQKSTSLGKVMEAFVEKDALKFFYSYYNINTDISFFLVEHPDFLILLRYVNSVTNTLPFNANNVVYSPIILLGKKSVILDRTKASLSVSNCF